MYYVYWKLERQAFSKFELVSVKVTGNKLNKFRHEAFSPGLSG